MDDIVLTALTLAQAEPSSAYIFWGLVLFAVALGVVALEVVIPSGGLLGLLAGACVVASVVSFFMYSATAGFVATLGYLILGPIILIFLFKLWVNSPLANRFVLGGSVAEDADFDGAPPSAEAGHGPDLRDLIGLSGETVTPLHPVGTVKIEGRRVEALAENGTIERGVPVVVTAAYDNQIKVRPE